MAHVGDEQVRLVPGQLGHQPLDAVAGVADRAGVDHLPFPRRVGLGQQRPEPAGEGGVVEERPAVGRRASQADDPVGAGWLVPREGLVVERLALVRDDGDHRLAGGIGLDLEVRHLGSESGVGIAAVIRRLHAARPEGQFEGQQDSQGGRDGKRQLLPRKGGRFEVGSWPGSRKGDPDQWDCGASCQAFVSVRPWGSSLELVIWSDGHNGGPHPRVKTAMAPAFLRARGHVMVFPNSKPREYTPKDIDRGASRTKYAFFKYHLVRAPKKPKREPLSRISAQVRLRRKP